MCLSFSRFAYLKHTLDNPDNEAPLVFLKSVSFPLVGRYNLLPEKSSNYRYSFLRHPFRVFKSWRKALFEMVNQLPELYSGSRKTWEEFTSCAIFLTSTKLKVASLKELYDQWQYVKKNLDPDPVIIDSDEVLSDPKHMLSKYCAALGIPYSDCLTEWDGDPKHVQKWWIPYQPLHTFKYARIFAQSAMYSKEFKKPDKLPSLDELSEDIKESYGIVKPYYEEMHNARMKP